MDREMESMGSNSVWSLIEAPKGVIKFDQVIKLYGFEKSPDEPCVYKKIQGIVVVFWYFT